MSQQFTILDKYFKYVFFIFLSLLLVKTQAQSEFKITASDAELNDNFGWDVQISGNNAAVGARFDKDLGTASGSVYFYNYTGTSWVQIQKVTASDGAALDNFGTSISIDGNIAVIGSPFDDDNASNSGSAYIFEFNGVNWIQIQKITASDGAAEDNFGYGTSISGNRIIVGSAYSDAAGSNSGAAYVYEFNGTNWIEQQKIIAADAFGGERFGWSVDISGDTIVIASPSSSDFGTASGAAYVFAFNGTSWVQFQKLLASDASGGDEFGRRVGIDGSHIICSGIYNDDYGSNSGSAYIFTYNGSVWNETAKLLPVVGAANDLFGSDVDLSGNLAIVGAYNNVTNSVPKGAAYIFGKTGTSWTQLAKLSSSDGAAGDQFGILVAIDGLNAICGATGDDDNGTNSGSTYIFQFDPPANDLCASAVPIQCGQTIAGSTGFAGNVDAPGNCVTSLNTAPGVWYQFTGTGESMVVNLCGSTYDTKLGVYSGICGALTCIAGNDDFCGAQLLQSQVNISTTLGTSYYVYVTGFEERAGSYSLTLTCVAPINNICANALPIGCGNTIIESTSNATKAGAPSGCVTSFNSAPGIWYSLAGTGDTITLSLCNSLFDTKIGVFAGNCLSSVCIAGNDDACGISGFGSLVTFPSVIGINYLIYVTGFNLQSGLFELNVNCGTPNDICSNALPIACGESVSGNTTLSTTNGNPGLCNGLNLGTAPGVWYRIDGTGEDMTVNLCASTYDTQLGIFTGSCGALTCFASNDDICGLQSGIVFSSVAGTTYYLYITGFQSNSGAYNISIACTPSNDVCSDAISITCGTTVTGSTDNATLTPGLPTCLGLNLSTAPGVWYRYTGQGGTVTASTCGSAYDTQLGVFTNTCGALTCITANDDICSLQSGVLFQTNIGQDYYIYVTGFQTNKGSFQMSLTCANPACTVAPVASSTNVTSNSVTLNWTAVTGAVNYRIQGSAAGGSVVTLMVPATPTLLTLNNLQSNTTFSWSVRSICNPGGIELSPASNISTFSTTSGCPIPAALNTTNLTANSVRLNWAIVSGATGYRISGNALGFTPDINLNVSGGATSFFNVISLAANTSYSWTVRGICPAGSSLPAQRDTFTTLVVNKTGDINQIGMETGMVQAIAIYPNPATDHVTIRMSSETHDDQVQVILYDLKGQQLLTRTIPLINGECQMDIPEQLESGVYQISLFTNTITHAQKLILLRK